METPKLYKYFRPETNAYEDVTEEFWQWMAVYRDLTILQQFDGNGRFHQIREINQKELVRFSMFSPYSDRHYDLHFNPEYMTLIHRYRRMRLNAGAANEVWLKLYCFGFERTINGETMQAINVIMPNGEIILTDSIDTITITTQD